MTYTDKLKEEFINISESDLTDHYFDGFSDRLHYFLDQVEDIDVPKRINRPTFLTKVTDCSRGAARQWLQLDQTPRGRYLLFLVIFFLRYIPSAKDISPIEVETWLKYGDSFISNPFCQLDDKQFLLAKTEIEKTAQSINLELDDFNFSKAISDISLLFKTKQIFSEKDITKKINNQIILHIGKHTFKETSET